MENEQFLYNAGQPETELQKQPEQQPEQQPETELQKQPERWQEQKQEPPTRRCARCNAPLYGDYCSACGLPEGGYVPYAPPPKKKKKLTALWVTLGVFLLAAVNVGAFVLVMLVAQSGEGTKEFNEEFYYEQPPYGGFNFDFGYTNETAYLRVDAMGTRRVSGTEEFTAPEGKEYLIVNLRITNLFGDIVAYDAGNFELSCGKGNLVPAQYTDIDTATALNYGRLLPGGEVDGSIVFLIPKGDLNLELFMYDYESTIRFPLL